MSDFFDPIIKLFSYDAERDFYAKHFPSIVNQAVVSYRPMKKSDITTIVEIEKQVYQFPWSEKTFRDCLNAGYHCLISERIGEIISYGIISIGAGESHVMNLCVSPKFQKQGFGIDMVKKLIDLARYHRADTMFLEVRPSNTAAIELYKKMGFNEIGLRKGYYPAATGREDAQILGFTL